MKNLAVIISAFIFCTNVLFAQNKINGSKAWLDNHPQRTTDPSVQNGSGTLGTIYDTTGCGINYTSVSEKLGMRFPLLNNPSLTQPATFPVNGLSFCSQTAKAYLWCVTAGNGMPVTASVTNPLGTTMNFPMIIAGSGPDMCWGYTGTYTYRADVTGIINGNGNYVISGLPIESSNTGNDVDGATLMIVYKDFAGAYTGSIHIDDGAIVTNGGTSTYNVSGFNSCANSTSANAFMIVADLQNLGSTITMNGVTPYTVNEDYWNFVTQPTSVTQAQSSCNYTVNSPSDCHCLAVAGLYSQTTCNTCNVSSVLNVSVASVTPASCSSNGAATISVSGGSGNYYILWNTNPVQTGLSISNLPAGTYLASVVDSTAGTCSAASVTIPYTGPVLTTSSTGVSCSSLGTASVTVTGGQSPYTYNWAPSGGTSANAANLSTGVYTVSVTDQTGCTINATATVPNNSGLLINTTSAPDSCPSPTGAIHTSVYGGTPPYTYSWAPGGQTTQNISNLTAGSYTVTVSDNAGCVFSAMASVNAVTVPMSVTVSGNSSVNCGDTLQLNATPNYSPATYVWSPSTYLNNPNIQNPTVIPFGPITYTVTATSQCGTGSNTFSVNINGNNPSNEQICMVSVDTTINKNVVTWERNNSPAYGSYKIYRETSTSGVYALIGTQPLSQFTTFTDMTSNPSSMANRYEITTSDTCGVQSTYSIPHRTIFLQASPAISGGFNLLWTPYEGVIIPTYNIYRGPSAGNLSLVTSVAGTIFNYTDGTPPAGTAYYMIEAVNSSWPCVPSRLINPDIASFNGSLSNLQFVTGVGINESEVLENSLLIIPNPGNGNFELSMEISRAQEIGINVFDNLGRAVFVQNENANAGNFKTTLNLSTLSSGVYFVQVKTTTGIATTRLIVN